MIYDSGALASLTTIPSYWQAELRIAKTAANTQVITVRINTSHATYPSLVYLNTTSITDTSDQTVSFNGYGATGSDVDLYTLKANFEPTAP